MLATTLNEIGLNNYMAEQSRLDRIYNDDYWIEVESSNEVMSMYRSKWEDRDEPLTDDEADEFYENLYQLEKIVKDVEEKNARFSDVIEFVLDNGMTPEEVREYA